MVVIFMQWLPRTSVRIVSISLAFLFVSALPISASEQADKEKVVINEQEIGVATSDFYAALNVMFTGDGQPMKALWSHASDITYMGPNGIYLVGWDDVEKEWDAQAASKLGGKVVAKRIHQVVGTNLAVINCIETGENVINGKSETVELRSSTVFRKEDGAWKVIGHQTDKLGYMAPPQ